ncbi:DUF4421 domain-containing protein [Echinicola jeungdonensis]|uniref:DUF4421 domain-containing protein n=1 Tax=Echinicola jeungdonensis TaxID=709343 RepID=A0ABV5J6U8_9BACT|nr:DUF4421 domain-containing protein [Echinicola jeungdonensis]MDN3668630.1 DUF4421 domain-containing protein [Echinicola jeungdonensis]
MGNRNSVVYFLFGLLVLNFLDCPSGYAQNEDYYQSFPNQVTSRFYFSKKYTGFNLKDKKNGPNWNYMPNTSRTMGVGATYNNISLNLATGFGFLNPEKGKGDSDYFDLQTHSYQKDYIIDLFLQFYSGYHLIPEGRQAPPGDNYYYRPDIKVTKIGASVKQVFNGDKFSYRAAFLQNEWQKKSAGTLLLGLEAYGGKISGDTTLIPPGALSDMERRIRQVSFFELGPNAGLAYTLVIWKRIFLMASASGNLGFGFTQIRGDSKEIKWGINANYFLRGSIGYNSEKWSINANYVYDRVRLLSQQQLSPSIATGNYRLNFIYRFEAGPKLKRTLDYLGWKKPW